LLVDASDRDCIRVTEARLREIIANRKYQLVVFRRYRQSADRNPAPELKFRFAATIDYDQELDC
jgi:hypothetical protein